MHLEMGDDEPWYNIPYSSYPARPGLFPWGHDANGTRYWWLTEGDAEKWPIIAQRKDQFERWDLPLMTFLAQVLGNKLKGSM